MVMIAAVGVLVTRRAVCSVTRRAPHRAPARPVSGEVNI